MFLVLYKSFNFPEGILRVHFIAVFITCHVVKRKWFGDHDNPFLIETLVLLGSLHYDDDHLFYDLKNNYCIALS